MSSSYEHGHTFLGIDLPDELFGIFETGSFIRAARRLAVVVAVLLGAAGAVWFVHHERAARAAEARLAPVQKAQAEVTFLEVHHGTKEEICDAQQQLVQAENVAMIGDGNDADHLAARTCALNLELERRLGSY